MEDDYQVHDYKSERMLIHDNGSHRLVELVSSIMIKHRTKHPVWVGSGFSLEERKSLFAEPERLLRSVVTIRYFEETSRLCRKTGETVYSLRFPSIKAIYSPDCEGRL